MSTAALPAAQAAAASAAEAGAPERAGRKRLRLIVLILSAGLVCAAGAYVLLGRGGSGEEAAAKPEPGQVVDLEPLTLNLADGRFLKVGLSLQLSADAPAAGGEGEGINGAKARDAAIGIFGQRTYAQLLTPKGRDAARRALDAEVRRRYPDEVLGIYLTEFVMQ
jgi:flagellar FliL protein